MVEESIEQAGNKMDWGGFLLCLIFVPLIAFLSLQSCGARKTKQWAAYVADLQSRGEPLTLAEVNAQRRAADAGNTVVQLLELLTNELESLPGRESGKHVLIFSPDSPTLTDGIPVYFVQPTRDFLARTAELRAHLVATEEMPIGRMEIRNAPTPVETLAFDSVSILNAGKLLKTSALAAVWDDDTTTAAQAARGIFRLAETLHDYPGPLAFIGETALCANGYALIEYMLTSAELDDAALAALHSTVAAADRRATLTWMLWGSRAVFVDTLTELSAGKFTKPGASGTAKLSPAIMAVMQGAPGKIFFQSNLVQGVKMYDRLINKMSDLPGVLAEARILEQELDALPKTQALTKLVVSPLYRPILLHMRGLAALRCTQIALAQERFRLRHGEWAQSQVELVPEYLDAMPMDPFNNQPLLMLRSEEGMIIYSVNDNLSDDGGSIHRTPVPGRRGFENLDLGFRLLPAEKRGVVILDIPPPEDD